MLSALRLFCTIDGVSPYRYQATTWWSDPDGESWEATFYWADVDGTAQVVGFDLHGFTGEWGDELEPVDEGESIPTLSASLLRQVPFGRLVDQSWRESRAFDEVLAGVTDDPVGALLSIQADLPPKGANEPQGRPTRVGLSHLGLVADIYKRARAQRRPPTKAVQEALALSYSTAAKRVGAARRLGLLEPTRQGSTGAIPIQSDEERSRD